MNNKTQPISQQDLSFDREHIWHPYTSMSDPLETYPVVSSQGCELTLSDGTVLVDGTSSWWACIHGYGHPAILSAMEQQLKKLSHVMFGGITHRHRCEQAFTRAHKP
jgi:adenosylmethionine-8-amino-7-oxononanoate aminotransferase